MRRILADIVLTAFVLIFFGAPFLFAATYTGPYRWLAEGQLAVFNSYGVVTTLVVTLVAWMLFCAFALAQIGRMLGGSVLKYVAPAKEPFENSLFRVYVVLSVIGAIVFFGIAGYYQHLRTTSTAPTPVSLSALESGQPLPSHYLKILDANADVHNAGSAVEGNSIKGYQFSTTYIPLLPAKYRPGDPVHVFLEAQGSPEFMTIPAGPVEGAVELMGLPGMVRVNFARHGFPPAKGYIVLEYSPPSFGLYEAWMAVAGGLCVLVCVLILVFRGRLTHPDGAYVHAAEEAKPIGHTLISNEFHEKFPPGGYQFDQITPSLMFFNHTAKAARAFTGTLRLCDLTDRPIKTVPITVDKPIPAEGTLLWSLVLPYDQLTPEERELKGKNYKTIRIKLTVAEIVYVDGSKEKFDPRSKPTEPERQTAQ